MAWKIRYTEKALRAMNRLDPVVRLRIADFIDKRVAVLVDPKQLGDALSGICEASGAIGSGITV